MTTRGEVTFTVKEYGSGNLWVAVEFHSTEHGFPVRDYGFDLEPGTTMDQAMALAKQMRSLIRAMKVDT